MILLSHWYDLSDVGTEELVKDYIFCIRLCNLSIERSDSRLYDSMQISK
ncbi:MAG: hypothetical protein ACMUEL_01780 [Flavobacteriales bacterium Tduv]